MTQEQGSAGGGDASGIDGDVLPGRPEPGAVQELAHRYGITDPCRVQQMTDQVVVRDLLPGAHERLAACEQMARSVRVFSTHSVPALVQTPEYAAATAAPCRRPLRPGPGSMAIARQMDGGGHRSVLVLLDESLLQRRTGGAKTMADQWAHLQKLVDQERAKVRIVPLDSRVYLSAPLLVELVLPGRYHLYADSGPDCVTYATGPVHGAHHHDHLDRIEQASRSPQDSYDLLSAARRQTARW